jgi:hypothetical protein
MSKWTETKLDVALEHFANGEEIQCIIYGGKINYWTFNLNKNNGTVILNPKMIKQGHWLITE